MKNLVLLVTIFLLHSFSYSQIPSDQTRGSDLVVLEERWRLDVHNYLHDKDPLKEIKGHEEEVREFVEVQRQNEIRAKQGLPLLPQPVRKPTVVGLTGVAETHVYEVRLKNVSKKRIKWVMWEYVFFEPGTNTELGRRYFESEVTIRPGKAKKVVEWARFAPTSTVEASVDPEKASDRYSEQIVIKRVEYSDGSSWQSS